MLSVVKHTEPNEVMDLRENELMQIFVVGGVNGWDAPDTPWGLFDKENADQLCETLKKGQTELEKSLLELESSEGPLCANCLMIDLTKRNLLELIDEFLWFCEGQPFRIETN